MRATLSNTQPQSTSETAFGFVRSLAAELSAGRVDLPSFPEIVIRVRRVLSNPNTTLDQVVRVVGSEPALAARLLRIANSASLNTSGRPITDLRTAINRMGYNMVRSASMSFAMSQIRSNAKLTSVKDYLDRLWEHSTLVAAFSFVIARTSTKINADEAMLTGMMHGIGKLYVLTRSADHPELFSDPDALNQIVEQWHAEIGKAILENWEFSGAVVQAVADQNDLDRTEVEFADLSDVVAIAILMAAFSQDPNGLQVALQELPAAARLGLIAARVEVILEDFANEVSALRSALGG
jgi:HD-like signal output (HDOD) protein